jgi:hypothetical protein
LSDVSTDATLAPTAALIFDGDEWRRNDGTARGRPWEDTPATAPDAQLRVATGAASTTPGTRQRRLEGTVVVRGDTEK